MVNSARLNPIEASRWLKSRGSSSKLYHNMFVILPTIYNKPLSLGP